MVYLDNAATTGKKPVQVVRAVQQSLQFYSANPGRGGHVASMKAGELVYNARKKAANFFGASAAEQVVFTASCTAALNMAIKGNLNPGDHVVFSSLEHNAVTRPVYALQKDGVAVDVAEVIFNDSAATLRSFERYMRHNTKMVICTHSSNVTGEVLPIAALGKICKERGILFVVDAAQTAGILPLHMQEQFIDYLCVAPHKGLYAPMGIGLLLASKPPLKTIIEGGTGVASALPVQPEELPERLEAGTLNVPGIAGVLAGIDYVLALGKNKLYQYEMGLQCQIYKGICQLPGIRLYTPLPEQRKFTPVLSFNVMGQNSNRVAEELNKAGFCVRGGLHCAPGTHKRLGTLETGTVRVSTAGFNTKYEAERFVLAVERLVQNKVKHKI